MSPAALSLFAFGIYVVVIPGLGFLVMPNVVLRLFRMPEAKEVWIRVLGFIIALLGVYYIVCGLYDVRSFAWATVFARFGVLLFTVVIALLKQAKPQIIVFGVVDTAGAVWTLLTLA